MARAISNVVIATDSFASWVGITNQMADTFTNYALTANLSSTGASTTGNAQLVGIFNANTVTVGTALRGGTIVTPANLNITTNTVFTGATISAASNVSITATNTFINSTTTYINGGLANVTSNVSVASTNTHISAGILYVLGGLANVTSNVSITNTNTSISTAVLYLAGGLANVTSNVSVVAANVTVNATAFRVRSGTMNVDSSVSITNTVSISNNLTLGGTAHTVAGNVAFDTSTLVIDATNKRVGFVNTTPDATLAVTGTANVSGAVRFANTLTVVGNTSITGNVTASNTMSVTGAVTMSNTLTVAGLANLASANVTTAVVGTLTSGGSTLNGNTTFNTDMVLAVISNTNLGATTGSALEIFNFPIATYGGAKVTAKIQSLSGANTQVQEIIIAQNQTDVVMTVYGTVSSPAAANLGVFSSTINTTAVSVKFSQSGANSNVKLITQLIK